MLYSHTITNQTCCNIIWFYGNSNTAGIIINTDVVSDAMGIYTNYIALNATNPIHIPDDIRQRVEGI